MTWCWKNRTVIDSIVPYRAHDEECDAAPTLIVLVPSYEEPGCPEFWPVLTCADHQAELMDDLTSEAGHDYPPEDLLTATVRAKEVAS